jgi:eukaryotic-like serine/threonine-protein kinase
MFTPGQVIKQKFEIINECGKGGMGMTYLAKNLHTGDRVVVKCLHLHRLKEWKSLELFKREALILKNITYPFIPDYVDFFEVGEGDSLGFVLIQEYVEGQNLLQLVNDGWRGTEKEIKQIALKLFRIINYIHHLNPPVIHRDINPRNIIIQEDGDIYLVDFGCVQDVMKTLVHEQSTFVGTPGYTPIEQFQGQATVRSDLYAAAATIVFLLTHKSVSDLANGGLKPDINTITTSLELKAILDNYLEPDQTKRTLPVKDAIAILEGTKALPVQKKTQEKQGGILGEFISEMQQLQQFQRGMETDTSITTDPGPAPAGSTLICSHTPEKLNLEIPPGSGGGGGGMGFFALIWNAFILIFTIVFVGSGFAGGDEFPFIVFPILIPFWAVGIGFGYAALFQKFGKTRIFLKRNGTGYIEKSFFGRTKRKTFETQAVQSCIMQVAYRSNNVPVYKCVVITPARRYSFGNKLTNPEKRWICDTANYWLNQGR